MPAMETAPVSKYLIDGESRRVVRFGDRLYAPDLPLPRRANHHTHEEDVGTAQVFIGTHGEVAILLPEATDPRAPDEPMILAGVGGSLRWCHTLAEAKRVLEEELNPGQAMYFEPGEGPPDYLYETVTSFMRVVISDRNDRARLLGSGFAL